MFTLRICFYPLGPARIPPGQCGGSHRWVAVSSGALVGGLLQKESRKNVY